MITKIIIIISCFAIGFVKEAIEPKLYELNMEDGTTNIVYINKTGQYACPSYCHVNHYHQVELIKGQNNINKNNYYILESDDKKKQTSFLGKTMIMSMNKINLKSLSKEKSN